MDLTKMSLNELKALAYDILVQAEQLQANLKLINEQIVKKNSENEIESKITPAE